MKAMMRDKDPERGINSGAEKRSVVKERLKKVGEGKRGGEERHININNLSLSAGGARGAQ